MVGVPSFSGRLARYNQRSILACELSRRDRSESVALTRVSFSEKRQRAAGDSHGGRLSESRAWNREASAESVESKDSAIRFERKAGSRFATTAAGL